MGKNILIFGASRGLGTGLSAGVPAAGDTAWLVSRYRPDALDLQDGVERHWFITDLLSDTPFDAVTEVIGTRQLDVVIYNAAIWELEALEPTFDFEAVEPERIRQIIMVNLTSTILCLQKLLPNLRQSANGKIILIGSTAGLENSNFREVAYVASKFGLRGVAHALREVVRDDLIGVTILNPGSIDTETAYAEGIDASLAASQGKMIPMPDIVSLIDCLIKLSPATCVKEINMPARGDRTA